MIAINTIRYISAERFCDEISECSLPKLYELYEIYGREIVYKAIDDGLCCADIDESDSYGEVIEAHWYAIISACYKHSGKKIPKSKLGKLELSEEDCCLYAIPWIDDRYSEGNEIIYMDEPPEQMKLFPEMEKGLPPYKMRIVRKKVN